jgi:hypothetical protein
MKRSIFGDWSARSIDPAGVLVVGMALTGTAHAKRLHRHKSGDG